MTAKPTAAKPAAAKAKAPVQAPAAEQAPEAAAPSATQTRRARVAELTGAGRTRAEQAAELGVSKYVIRNDQHALNLAPARPEQGKREQVAQAAADGTLTIAQIAEATGLSTAGAAYHARKLGITPPRPGRADQLTDRRAQVAAMTAEGKTRKQIAEALGVTVWAVRGDQYAAKAAAA